MRTVPLGISNRHLHLSQADAEILFGPGYQLQVLKELSQPGQFACQETVDLVGPKGEISKVRILGPYRKQTQVEILMSDCYKLGIKAPVRLSGDLAGSAGIKLVGPAGAADLSEGVVVAARHLHAHPDDLDRLGITDGAEIAVRIPGERGVVFEHIHVRAHESFALDLHIDVEEGNAAAAIQGMEVEVL